MTRLAAVLLAVLVGLSPFWLGSNRALPWSFNAVLVGAIALAAAAGLALEARRYPSLRLASLAVPALLFGLAMIWAGFQLAPVGVELGGHPAWPIAGEALERPLAAAITVNPAETRWALLRWLTAALVFLAAYCLAREPANAGLLYATVLAVAALAAAYGLVRVSLSLDKILWFDTPRLRQLTSGFVNANSAATFFGMASLAALAVVVDRVRAVLRQADGDTLRGRLEAVGEQLAGRLGIALVAFVLFFVALLATVSRAGIVFTLVGAVVLLLLYGLRGRAQRRAGLGGAGGVVATATGALLIVGLLELSGARLARRLADQGFESIARFEAYGNALGAVRDYLAMGSGLGTFQDVYPAYRIEAAPTRELLDKAHNDYIELVLGLGLPAALMVLAALGLLVARALTGFFQRRRNASYAAAAVAVAVLAGLHSLVDFSLQIQANTLLFALLLGVGVAQSFRTRE